MNTEDNTETRAEMLPPIRHKYSSQPQDVSRMITLEEVKQMASEYFKALIEAFKEDDDLE